MKLIQSFLLTAILGCLAALEATAQAPGSVNRFRPAGLTYGYYRRQAEVSPSDVPIRAPDANAEPPAVSSESFGGAACMSDCICDSCCNETAWRLFPASRSGWSLTGWLEAGATASADHPASRRVHPVGFNDRQEVQLNQLYAVIARPMETHCNRWDAGGRVDLLYGTDARFTEVPGLELRRDGTDHWNSRTFYRLSMPQIYGEVGYGDLSVKVGHWYSTIGYEVVPGPKNFFYSHGYARVYGEPFTHTGVLGSWTYSDRLSFYSGIHNGWDNFDGVTDRAGLLTGFNWTSCDDRLGIALALSHGDEINSLAAYSERSIYSLVVNYQLSDCLQYVFQHDSGWQDDDGGANVDAEWYGINQYLLYTLNDCWSAGARFEWFRDDDGVRVSDFDGNTGFAGNFYQMTAGVKWTPRTNLIVRPEIRWDWYDGVGVPYDDGTKDEQFTAAFDAILLY